MNAETRTQIADMAGTQAGQAIAAAVQDALDMLANADPDTEVSVGVKLTIARDGAEWTVEAQGQATRKTTIKTEVYEDRLDPRQMQLPLDGEDGR